MTEEQRRKDLEWARGLLDQPTAKITEVTLISELRSIPDYRTGIVTQEPTGRVDFTISGAYTQDLPKEDYRQ
jgi:hypothetical protein